MAFGIGGSAIAEAPVGGSRVESSASLPNVISVSGFASTNAFGPLHTRQTVQPVGITPRAILGVIGGKSNQYRPLGIASGLHIGAAVATRVATRGSVVVPVGIASGLKLGQPNGFFRGLVGRLLLVGIAGGSRLGQPHGTAITPAVPPKMSAHTLWQLFNYCSQQVSMAETPRMVKLQFGDGYAQVSGDGLSPVDRTLTLAWDMLDTAEADVIVAVLRAWTGVVLPFVAPREKSPRKWLVKTWDRQPLTYGIDSMTATFEERLYEGPLQ
jgi:phage-related protein